MSLMVCLLTLAVVPSSSKSAGHGTHLRATTLRAVDDDSSSGDSSSSSQIVEPMSFEQTLIVCNAYPSQSEMIVSKNGERMANMSSPMPFRECRHLTTQLQPHDKLDLMLLGLEIHGSFEVGGLPSSDSVLLLVVQKREQSHLINFKSFAFPLRSDTQDAQLAVIDAFPTTEGGPGYLRMEDALTDKRENPMRRRRLEELSFNRVYSVEQGTYDAVTSDSIARKMMKLWDGTDYILLRTGDGSNEFPESLVLYPDITDLHEMRNGAACASWPLLACLNILFLMLSLGP